jgi:hypothetical protein
LHQQLLPSDRKDLNSITCLISTHIYFCLHAIIFEMGGRIPEQIRREVIQKWLLGEKRHNIAADLDIGDGTVSEIMKLYSQKDSEVDFIRQVALAIKSLQTDVSTFSQAVRLNILNELGLREEQIESLITVAEGHCFKRNLKLEEFFEIVEEVASYSDKVGMPLEDLPDHLEEQKRSLEELCSDIEDAQNNLSVVLRNNDVTLKDLENYKKDKPVIERLELAQIELEKVTNERDGLREQIVKERFEMITQKHEWMVPEHELEEANKQLINDRGSAPIRYNDLYHLANSFFRQPSKYVDVIEALRKQLKEERKSQI